MNQPKISLIAAIGKNRELGKDNKLLWHISADLKHFKEVTTGHVVIMGRKTFESIGIPLPKRLNVIITRDRSYKPDGVTICHTLEEAIETGSKYSVASSKHTSKIHSPATDYKLQATDENEVFIIGGGQIFEQALPIADRLYLTIIDASFPADTFFPDYSQFNQTISKKEAASDGYRYSFLVLEK